MEVLSKNGILALWLPLCLDSHQPHRTAATERRLILIKELSPLAA
jgi:hypothetical protein